MQLRSKMLLPHHFGLDFELPLPACWPLVHFPHSDSARSAPVPVCAAFPGVLHFYSAHQAYQSHSARPVKPTLPPVLPWYSSLCGCVFWRKVLNRKPLLWISALVLVRRARLGSQERWNCSVNGGSLDTFTLRASWSHTSGVVTGLSSPLYLLSPWGCFRPRQL